MGVSPVKDVNMNNIDIKVTVKNIIRQIANEQSIPIQDIADEHAIVDDLGFCSLDIATLVALLETEFDVDPFINGLTAVTEIRTVNDICEIYTRFLKDKNNIDK